MDICVVHMHIYVYSYMCFARLRRNGGMIHVRMHGVYVCICVFINNVHVHKCSHTDMDCPCMVSWYQQQRWPHTHASRPLARSVILPASLRSLKFRGEALQKPGLMKEAREATRRRTSVGRT